MADLALTMPKMSMTMEEGTMVIWLKKVGDPVKAGEPVCEVTTDKVDMEVESPFDGTLARITAQVDDVVKVGDPIGYITTDADDLLGGLFDEPAPSAGATTTETTGAAENSEATGTASSAVKSDWVAAVPAARALADEKGIDLGTVAPSGAWGSVRVADVEAASGAPAGASVTPEAAPVTSVPADVAPEDLAPTESVPGPGAPDLTQQGAAALAAASTVRTSTAPATHEASVSAAGLESRRRRTRMQVAKVMSRSAAVPQFTAYLDLDLETTAAVRKTRLGGASWTAILVKAQALALREHPQLGGSWSEDGVVPSDEIGIAIAVDSPVGLMAPVIRNPDRLPLDALVTQIGQAVESIRAGTATVDQLSGGTTVFSNLGGFGVTVFNALLTPPHATALSSGAVRKIVVVHDDGSFGPRLTVTVGLTVDHRVADGADAARYLATLRDIVANPDKLL